jgi:hypothetical protein
LKLLKKNTNTTQQVAFALGGLILGFFFFTLLTSSTEEGAEDEAVEASFRDEYKVIPVIIPESMDFAGEAVPLSEIDIRERLDRELTVNTYWQSQTLLSLKKAHRWFPVISPILEEEGVPQDFKYLALIESGLDNIVSPAGAAGFWQILKSTATEGGLRLDEEVDERYHLEKATRFACKYLKTAKEKFGTWTAAAASYNMGMNGYQRQVDSQGSSNYYNLFLNSETSRYVFRILAAKAIVSHPEKYGFYLRNKDLYPTLETFSLRLDTSITDVYQFALQSGINYKLLRRYNPWIRGKKLSVSTGDSLIISLPDPKQLERYRQR